jgi:hypothetical protein
VQPFGQHVVLQQGPECFFRKLGADIACQLMLDLRIATTDQNIRDRYPQLRTRGDGQKMRIALSVGDRDQIGIGQAWRLRQDRTCHSDIVVQGEPSDRLDRRVLNRCEHLAEPDQRAQFDALDQMHQHIVEKLDLFFGERIGALEEEIRDAQRNVASPSGIPVSERVPELRDEGRCDLHPRPIGNLQASLQLRDVQSFKEYWINSSY